VRGKKKDVYPSRVAKEGGKNLIFGKMPDVCRKSDTREVDWRPSLKGQGSRGATEELLRGHERFNQKAGAQYQKPTGVSRKGL